MKGKTIFKSLIVAIITTVGVVIAISFFQGCVATTSIAPVQVNTCDIVAQSKILGSIGAFIFSFISSLIAFGWRE